MEKSPRRRYGTAAEIAEAEKLMNGFETLTLAPIDRRLIDTNLLTPGEIGWLDAYHARVRETLSSAVDAETGNPKVVYRRKGWNYGVIELDAELPPSGRREHYDVVMLAGDYEISAGTLFATRRMRSSLSRNASSAILRSWISVARWWQACMSYQSIIHA